MSSELSFQLQNLFFYFAEEGESADDVNIYDQRWNAVNINVINSVYGKKLRKIDDGAKSWIINLHPKQLNEIVNNFCTENSIRFGGQ